MAHHAYVVQGCCMLRHCMSRSGIEQVVVVQAVVVLGNLQQYSSKRTGAWVSDADTVLQTLP
jgi:hypothetical protein